MNSKLLSLISAAMMLSLATNGTARAASVAETVDDASITVKVKSALVASPATKARQINVTTSGGEVTISGFVDSATSKEEAERVARGVTGVVAVRNDLAVRSGVETTGNAVDDSMITAKVKARLLDSPDTKARDIHVATAKGVVELAGSVDSPTEKAHAEDLARQIDGVRDVVNRLTIK
jgi:hyperosmotically inducible protein